MFENLSLQSEERRISESPLKVEASPEVTALVVAAWGKQQETGDTASLGHIVGPVGDKEAVEQFHAQARAACNGHEPRLKYRRLTRVGKSKDENKAYFAVALWPEGEDKNDTAPETPGTDSDTDSADETQAPESKTPPTRRRTGK